MQVMKPRPPIVLIMLLLVVLIVAPAATTAFLAVAPPSSSHYHPTSTTTRTQRHGRTSAAVDNIIPLSLLSNADIVGANVDVFSGSDIVDPIVVSNVFWTSLKAKFLSVIIGQILAIVVFAFITSFAADQIRTFSDTVLSSFNKREDDKTTTTFRKMPTNMQTTTTMANDANSNNNTIEPDFAKLLVCIVIDFIGTSSEFLPVVGELTDVVWAPIAALLLRSLYSNGSGSNTGNILFVLEFAEEILPFTDVLPLATICWVIDTYFADSNLAQLLQLGNYNNNINNSPSSTSSDVIDVDAVIKPDNNTNSMRRLKSSSNSSFDENNSN